MDEKAWRRLCAGWPGVGAGIKWDDGLAYERVRNKLPKKLQREPGDG